MHRVLVFALLAGVALGACTVGEPEFVAEIEEATVLDGSAGRPLDLDEVTQFEWDTVHVFGPYTPAHAIIDALGFRWRDGEVEGPDADGRQLIVFVRDRSVVGAAVMDRCRPDFVTAEGAARGLTQSEARFRLEARGDCWQAEVGGSGS